MHPEILRELTAQRGREMRARAHPGQARPDRDPAGRRRPNRPDQADGFVLPTIPDYVDGSFRTERQRGGGQPGQARRWPARRARRPPAITPPEAAMTVPSIASDPSGMSDPRGMVTLEMSGRASSPVLVGRDEQTAALEAAFASARQGGPSAVLLGGEAGVGKSRLVSEFGRTPRRRRVPGC